MLSTLSSKSKDVRGRSKLERTAGKVGASRASRRPLQYRSVKFLTSKFGLQGSTIWGSDMSSSQRRSAPDAFTEFLAAHGKLSEANQSVSYHALQDSGDELQCIEVPSTNKRKALTDTATSSAAKRPTLVHCDMPAPTTASIFGQLSSDEASTVAKEVKSKIMSLDLASLVVGASTRDSIYTDLLKAIATFHLVEKKMASSFAEVANKCKVVDDLTQKVDLETKRAAEAHLELRLKDEKLSYLGKQLHECSASILELQTNSEGLVKDKELLEREIVALRKRNAAMKHELNLYLSGAKIIARWEAAREFLLGENKNWKFEELDSQYEHVMRIQAQHKGMPPPLFEESLTSLATKEQAISEHDTSEPSPIMP